MLLTTAHQVVRNLVRTFTSYRQKVDLQVLSQLADYARHKRKVFNKNECQEAHVEVCHLVGGQKLLDVSD